MYKITVYSVTSRGKENIVGSYGPFPSESACKKWVSSHKQQLHNFYYRFLIVR